MMILSSATYIKEARCLEGRRARRFGTHPAAGQSADRRQELERLRHMEQHVVRTIERLKEELGG
jgi:hypothetical protein